MNIRFKHAVRASALCTAIAMLTGALTACDLSDVSKLIEDAQQELSDTPSTEGAWRVRATSVEEMYHHVMYAAAEGYVTAVLELDLPQPVSVETLTKDHSFRFIGNELNYYVLEGEDGEVFQHQTVLVQLAAPTELIRQREKSEIEAGEVYKWRNAVSVLRQRAVKESPSRRTEDFENFPIVQENAGQMQVRNSEQLWIALEKNYLPTFPQDEQTEAERIWQLAAEVLRTVITEDMTEMQKLCAIYDWLCEKVQYHHPLTMAAGSHREDAEHFPEGVFEHHLAVCDGIAKTAVILCRMEGIPCLLMEGTGAEGGHAWNAVYCEGEWYTFCATYGMMEVGAETDMAQALGGPLGWTSYRTFLAPLSYMDGRFPSQTAHTALADAAGNATSSTMDRPVIPGLDADLHMETVEELEQLFAALVRAGLREQYYIELTADRLPLDLEMVHQAAAQSDPLIQLVLFKYTDDTGIQRYTVFVQ